jgi:hypothetical protein
LFATIWPVASIPLHFKLNEHSACHIHSEKKELSISDESSYCAICNFEFWCRILAPTKQFINRIDILLEIKNETHTSPSQGASIHNTYLRGPPQMGFI